MSFTAMLRTGIEASSRSLPMKSTSRHVPQPEPASTRIATMFCDIESYVQLQRVIGEALRKKNPEWIDASRKSPLCDFYEARLAELLNLCAM